MTDQLDTVTQAALAKAGAEARQAFGTKTAGILDTLKSIDWKKHVGTKSDARNALIGSALGGLALGGASLLSDRDPEESKATPVGDALLGAILGGAAGYGIPRGLHLFAHGNDADTSTAKPGGGVLSAIDNRLTKWFGPDSKIPLWSKGYLTGALGLGMAGAREADWRLARLRADRRIKVNADKSWLTKYLGAIEPWQTAKKNLNDARSGIGAANKAMLDAIDAAEEKARNLRGARGAPRSPAYRNALKELYKARLRHSNHLAALRRTVDTNLRQMEGYSPHLYRASKMDLETRINQLKAERSPLRRFIAAWRNQPVGKAPSKDEIKELKSQLKELNKSNREAKRGRPSVFTRAGRTSITEEVGKTEPKPQGKIKRVVLGPSDRYKPKNESVLPGRGVKGQSRWNRARGGLLGLGVGGLLDYALGEVAKRNADAAKSGK